MNPLVLTLVAPNHHLRGVAAVSIFCRGMKIEDEIEIG
jgi:hypothetical protein